MPTGREIAQLKEKATPPTVTQGGVEEKGSNVHPATTSEEKVLTFRHEEATPPQGGEGKETESEKKTGKGKKGQPKGQQSMKSKGGGKGKVHKSKPPQHSKDTMKKFEEQLRRPVDIRDLASRYGLDSEKMEKVIGKEDEVGEDKQATR